MIDICKVDLHYILCQVVLTHDPHPVPTPPLVFCRSIVFVVLGDVVQQVGCCMYSMAEIRARGFSFGYIKVPGAAIDAQQDPGYPSCLHRTSRMPRCAGLSNSHRTPCPPARKTCLRSTSRKPMSNGAFLHSLSTSSSTKTESAASTVGGKRRRTQYLWPIDHAARRFPSEEERPSFIARVNAIVGPILASKGLKWEYNIYQHPPVNWRVSGMVPPVADPEIWHQWIARDSAVPYWEYLVGEGEQGDSLRKH